MMKGLSIITALIIGNSAVSGSAKELIANGTFDDQSGWSGEFQTATGPSGAFPVLDTQPYFWAGDREFSEITQVYELTAQEREVLANGGTIEFEMSGDLFGYDTQEDASVFEAKFLEASGGNILGRASLSSDARDPGAWPEAVTAGTSPSFRSTFGELPAGTKWIEFSLSASRVDGVSNDGYADNLRFEIDAMPSSEPSDSQAPRFEDISVDDGRVSLSWVRGGPEARLQYKKTLGHQLWEDAPSATGSSATLEIAEGRRFFRLLDWAEGQRYSTSLLGDGNGEAGFALAGETFAFDVNYEGLPGPAETASLAVDDEPETAIQLDSLLPENGRASGQFSGAVELPPRFLEALEQGNLRLNIGTADQPAGVVQGAAVRDWTGANEWADAETTGRANTLTILVDHQLDEDGDGQPDNPRPSRQKIKAAVFRGDPSVRGYFLANSDGQFTVKDVGTLGWYTTDKPGSHYFSDHSGCPDGFGGENGGHVEMRAEAIEKADADVDFSQWDINNDGVVRPNELGILVVTPGGPGGVARPIFAQKCPTAESMVVDGVELRGLIIAKWEPGFNRGENATRAGMSVAAEELGHVILGLEDRYVSDVTAWQQRGEPNDFTLADGRWRHFAHLDAPIKLRRGWVTPRVVSSDGSYTVEAIKQSNEALVIPHPNYPNRDEYFVIANRQQGQFYDVDLPDTGLAIWHVIEDQDIRSRLPATGNWQRRGIRMVRSNGVLSPDDSHALWDGGSGDTRVQLNWIDEDYPGSGQPSGIFIEDIPPSNDEMTIRIDFPPSIDGPPDNDAPVMYSDSDFSGTAFLVAGDELENLRNHGFNDMASSIFVPVGKTVLLFRHSDFRDPVAAIQGPRALADFGSTDYDDEISSVKVVDVTCVTAPILFQDRDFGGKAWSSRIGAMKICGTRTSTTSPRPYAYPRDSPFNSSAPLTSKTWWRPLVAPGAS